MSSSLIWCGKRPWLDLGVPLLTSPFGSCTFMDFKGFFNIKLKRTFSFMHPLWLLQTIAQRNTIWRTFSSGSGLCWIKELIFFILIIYKAGKRRFWGQERTKNQSPSFFFILWHERVKIMAFCFCWWGEISGTIILWLQVIKRIKRQRVGKILISFSWESQRLWTGYQARGRSTLRAFKVKG